MFFGLEDLINFYFTYLYLLGKTVSVCQIDVGDAQEAQLRVASYIMSAHYLASNFPNKEVAFSKSQVYS